MQRILVWDAPTRLGHWLLAASFAVAWLTSESESWKAVHLGAGMVAGGVVIFRLVWGFLGTRHARFASFAYSPRAALGYLAALAHGRPAHFTGHNPAGSYGIWLLLALGLVVCASGICANDGIGGSFGEEFHEGSAAMMLAVVALHLAGVVAGSLAHQENLARAMITGRKTGAAEEAVPGPRRRWLIVLGAVVGAAIWISGKL